jgi:predicted membrane-bound mannosyltransferase
LRRGSDAGIHAAPWYEYLRLITAFRPGRGFFWSEGMIVGLAVCGGVYSLLSTQSSVLSTKHSVLSPQSSVASANDRDTEPSPVFCHFLTFYTLVLLGLYSVIPYKTPWCLLSFLHGMILLAGVGVYALLRWVRFVPLKLLTGGLLLAGAAHLGWETYWLNFRLEADPRNPYVYAHTSRDVLNLAAQMDRLAQLGPSGRGMVIHVVTPENYWPIPWYLRRFDRDRVGFWQDPAAWARDAAGGPAPEVIMLTANVQEAVDAHLRAPYNKQMIFGLRPGVFVLVYVREDLWQAFIGSHGNQS